MKRKKENVNEIVRRNITEKILSQEWGPGTKIASENQLSQELGVSRMSVREAIEKMVALNILSKKQGGGTYVNKLSPSIYMNSLIPMVLLEEHNILEIQEFRKIIEVDSARLCAERCGNETIEQLEKYYGDMCKYNSISEEFAYADFSFHRAIAEGTGNSLIIKVNSILTELLKYQQTKTNKYLGPSGGLVEHRKILDAIKDRDPELAAIYMKRHVEITLDKIKEIYLKRHMHEARKNPDKD